MVAFLRSGGEELKEVRLHCGFRLSQELVSKNLNEMILIFSLVGSDPFIFREKGC